MSPSASTSFSIKIKSTKVGNSRRILGILTKQTKEKGSVRQIVIFLHLLPVPSDLRCKMVRQVWPQKFTAQIVSNSSLQKKGLFLAAGGSNSALVAVAVQA